MEIKNCSWCGSQLAGRHTSPSIALLMGLPGIPCCGRKLFRSPEGIFKEFLQLRASRQGSAMTRRSVCSPASSRPRSYTILVFLKLSAYQPQGTRSSRFLSGAVSCSRHERGNRSFFPAGRRATSGGSREEVGAAGGRLANASEDKNGCRALAAGFTVPQGTRSNRRGADVLMTYANVL